MNKKKLAVLLVFTGILFVSISLLGALGFFKAKRSGILIETEPSSDIYINGQFMGETPYEASLSIGEMIVKVVPDKIEGQTLPDYEIKVRLEPGVKTIIKRSFNQNKDLESGALVSFEKVGGEDSLISVVSVPDNAQVFIDQKPFGFAPIRTKTTAGEHQLLISSQGYLDKSLPVRVYKGYKLTAAVKLAKDTAPQSTPLPVLSETTESLGKVEILETDIGYLRVRKEPDTGSEMVGQVHAGEVYDVLEENPPGSEAQWYKIEFETIIYGESGGIPQKIQGWVSGQFAAPLQSAP